MTVLKDGERLYLDSWNYNAALILTELAKIVKNYGGRVKPTHTAIISNRTITKMRDKYERDVARLETLEANEQQICAIKLLKEKLSELNEIDNEVVLITHLDHISFIYDNFYYYYQVDSNPFFEFYYSKTPITNGEYSRDACLEEDKKVWLHDHFLKYGCSKEDIKAGANQIFEMLVGADASGIKRISERKRVPNLYDGSYHYETISIPERTDKIDF